MFSNMKREDKGVIENREDGTSYCLTDIRIVVPIRYQKIELCNINLKVECYGVFAILHGKNKFKLLNMPAMVIFEPYKTEKVTYNNVEYFLFHIRKGEPFANRTLVVNTNPIKPICEEFLVKGGYPWFLGYEDARDMYENFKTYCGSNIAEDVVIVDFILSLNARTERDYRVHWRMAKPTDKLEWIGIANVPLSRADGFNKMTGAYIRDGLISASLHEKDEQTNIEKIIK